MARSAACSRLLHFPARLRMLRSLAPGTAQQARLRKAIANVSDRRRPVCHRLVEASICLALEETRIMDARPILATIPKVSHRGFRSLSPYRLIGHHFQVNYLHARLALSSWPSAHETWISSDSSGMVWTAPLIMIGVAEYRFSATSVNDSFLPSAIDAMRAASLSMCVVLSPLRPWIAHRASLRGSRGTVEPDPVSARSDSLPAVVIEPRLIPVPGSHP